MTTFESDQHSINAGADVISEFLSNMEHLKHLLPLDRIENLKLSREEASFKIKGLAEINITLDKHSNEQVIYRNATEKPFPFDLEVKISNSAENPSCQVFFHAEVNNFMGMMMKTPLTNFLNALAKNLQKHYE